MTKRTWLLTCFLAAGAALATLSPVQAQEKASGKVLKVQLNYTGAGPVDDKHRILLFLFDSPDFMSGGGMPNATMNAASKDAVVTFAGVDPSPVYLVAVYDPTGAYDGLSGPPPSGAILGVYSTTPGQPAPIKLDSDKPTEVTLAFGDSMKRP